VRMCACVYVFKGVLFQNNFLLLHGSIGEMLAPICCRSCGILKPHTNRTGCFDPAS